MCNLSQVKKFSLQMTSSQIKNLTGAQLALKKKNDMRAFALLKVLAASQIVSSPDLSKYPILEKSLNERKLKK